MKKATLVLATAVAFLLSGPVFAARKVVDMPSTGSILTGATSTIAENGVLKVSGGALVGEYIPGVKNALAILPEAKIASSAISGLAKNVIKGGVAGIVVGAALDGLIDGVGWVIEDGKVVKHSSGSPVTTNPAAGEFSWAISGTTTPYSSPDAACAAFGSSVTGASSNLVFVDPTHVACHITRDGFDFGGDVFRNGNHCPSGTTYSNGSCVSSLATVPVTDADLGVLDGFVRGKDGVWQRDLATDLCSNNENCYKALAPDISLTGPAKVTGTPQTVTTTSPSGAVSTSVKTPTSTITYGPNYYDYTTTTTTTTNNGGDTTTVTDDTDTSLPVPPNIFGGANDGIGGIPGDIAGTTSHTSPIPYMPWWSFSQSCEEITFVIPVYGAVTTAICPVYKKYIWPVLYFMFAVYTWLSCWGIWRATVLKVRAF